MTGRPSTGISTAVSEANLFIISPNRCTIVDQNILSKVLSCTEPGVSSTARVRD